MKKSILLLTALMVYGQTTAMSKQTKKEINQAAEAVTKDIAYAAGVNVINESRSYKLQVLGLANMATDIPEAGTTLANQKIDMGYVPVNALTKRFTIRAINDQGVVVADKTVVRGPNEDVFVVNVSSSGGLTKHTINVTAYSAAVAAGMKKYKDYDLYYDVSSKR